MIAIGDSHTIMFEPFTTSIKAVSNASMYGVMNPDSVSNSCRKFTRYLNNSNEDCIICLGEIDCNALFWRKNLSVDEYITKAIYNLVRFLSAFKNNFIISSIIPPAIQVNSKRVQRSDISASLVERFALTEKFNKFLQLLDYKYLDITSHLITKSTDKRFIRTKDDPHLKLAPVRVVIRERLSTL